MKKIISAALAILLMASNALAVNLYVDGRELKPDVPPVLVSGRTLVPVRVILESLGATVSWNDTTQTAIAAKAGTTIAITLNSKTAFVNGQAKTLDVPAMTINGRTMVPARFVSETLNADITWDNDTETVYITTTEPGNTIDKSNVTSPTTSADTTITSPAEEKPVSTSHKIYRTKTGKRYHYDSHCNGGTYFECSLQDALNAKLTPCLKCVN